MAAANQSTRTGERGDAVSDNICIHHTDAERKERIGCPICLRRELAAVTAERDALRADLCTFAVDMERELSASQQEARRLREALQRAMDGVEWAVRRGTTI